MAELPLTLEQFALVDQEDLDSLSVFLWSALWSKSMRQFYAVRTYDKPDGSRGLCSMHRQIMGAQSSDPRFVDHINGITLDNRRENLRFATPQQNTWNRGKHKGKSKFKGVYPGKDQWLGAFKATITVNGNSIILGWRGSEEEAAQLYDLAAAKYFGEFARLNFPKGLLRTSEGSPAETTANLQIRKLMNRQVENKDWFSVAEVAVYLGLGVSTVYRLLYTKKLSGVKIREDDWRIYPKDAEFLVC